MLLTREELEALTGYERFSRQIDWLRKHGYMFMVRPDGSPVVLRAHADEIKVNGQQKNRHDANGLLEREAIMRRAVSVKPVSGIYFLFAGGRIVYIGKSKNIMGRVAEHIADREKCFDAFSCIAAPISKLSALEAQYIKKFTPHHNVTHNEKRARRSVR